MMENLYETINALEFEAYLAELAKEPKRKYASEGTLRYLRTVYYETTGKPVYV